MVFIYNKEYAPVDKYFTIKINKIKSENDNEIMISIIDASHEILCNNEKQHNEVLTMVNATVSHEIRNPLNSIVAINL